MQAMILAAGIGKRMQPLTNNTPKPLLQLHDKPLIIHLINSLYQQGVTKIVINLFHLGDQIKKFLQHNTPGKLTIDYSEEQELLDTGGGIVNALSLLDNEPFIVVSADIYTNYPFAKLKTSLTKNAHIVLVDNPAFHQKGDFALDDNGQVKLHGDNMLTYSSIGIFTHDFFKEPPKKIFPLNFLLKRAINNNLLTGEYFSDLWYNIGTEKILQQAQADIKIRSTS